MCSAEYAFELTMYLLSSKEKFTEITNTLCYENEPKSCPK